MHGSVIIHYICTSAFQKNCGDGVFSSLFLRAPACFSCLYPYILDHGVDSIDALDVGNELAVARSYSI